MDTDEMSFDFIVENTTDFDFRLSDSSTYSILVSLKQGKALTSDYAPKLTHPIFVPAKHRTTLSLKLSCPKGCADDIGGFALFDEATHYEINLDLPSSWQDKN